MSTIAEASEHICLKERRFRELLDRGVITRQAPGQYDLDTVRCEYLRHLEKAATERRAKIGDDAFRTEQARIMKGRADILERQNEVTRASFLPRDDVRVAVTSAFDRVRRRVRQIPATLVLSLAAVGAPANAQRILADGIEDALQELKLTQIKGFSLDDKEVAR